MSKKIDTWMPLLVDKYLGDTTHLTTEQHGAYLLLLMAMWKRDGVLPLADQQLAAIARMPAARWRLSRPVLMEFFKPTGDGNGLTQKRLSEELQRARTNNDKKSEAGAKGAAKRWQKSGPGDGEGNADANGTGMADALADGEHKVWQTGAPTPTPSASQRPDTASAVSLRGQIGLTLKRAGVDMTRVSLPDVRLEALVAQGIALDEVEAVAREAVAKGIGKPLGWVVSTIAGRHRDAAALAIAPQAASTPARPMAWADSRSEVIGMGCRLGLAWEELNRATGTANSWPAYRNRVIEVWKQAHPQEAAA